MDRRLTAGLSKPIQNARLHRELARRRLPRQLFDYIDGGAYAENTLRANVDDLAAIPLRQRILRDVSYIDLSVELLGEEPLLPVVLGPVGLVRSRAAKGKGR